MSDDVKIEIDGLDNLINPFERMSKGLDFRGVNRFEKTLFLAFAETQARVHVLTGRLKASGTKRSNNDGSVWTGEIEYLHHPGVFELARGDKPTRNHPEGGHDFFGGLDDFTAKFEENIDDYFKDAFDKNAPL